jgi:hypothetical protein
MPKATSKRWRVAAQPAKGSQWRRLGRAHYTQSTIEAAFIPVTDTGGDDETRPRALMRVELDDRNFPQIRKLTLGGAAAPLTPTSIRLPLRAMARAAIACVSYRLVGENTAVAVASSDDVFTIEQENVVHELVPELLAELERDARMRARNNPLTDDVLEKVAEIVARVAYRERRRAVMDAFGVSYFTAKAWIAEAHQRGLIRAGGADAGAIPRVLST